mgnify:FL=1
MRRVFAFDFDGTLTTTDTLIAVIRYARGTAALAVGLLLYSPMLVLMKMGLYPNWKAKQRLFAHFFGGWSLGRFDSCCQQFAATHSHLLRPEGIRLMRQVLAEGAQVAIVSASIDNWVAPFFDGMGDVAHRPLIIGTRIEVRGGRLTGRFCTPNCYGPEKVRRLHEALPHRDTYTLTAFGDSRGDKELLEDADERHYKPFR